MPIKSNRKPIQPHQTFHFTPEGYEKLKQEYQDLLQSRPEAVEHLKKAREMGDLSENGYYKASKSKLISIDIRLRRLSYMLKRIIIINPINNQTVHLGNTVTLEHNQTPIKYTIVGKFESNPAENKISNISPLGQALIGKTVGQTAEVTTPTQKSTYKIINIQ